MIVSKCVLPVFLAICVAADEHSKSTSGFSAQQDDRDLLFNTQQHFPDVGVSASKSSGLQRSGGDSSEEQSFAPTGGANLGQFAPSDGSDFAQFDPTSGSNFRQSFGPTGSANVQSSRSQKSDEESSEGQSFGPTGAANFGQFASIDTADFGGNFGQSFTAAAGVENSGNSFDLTGGEQFNQPDGSDSREAIPEAQNGFPQNNQQLNFDNFGAAIPVPEQNSLNSQQQDSDEDSRQTRLRGDRVDAISSQQRASSGSDSRETSSNEGGVRTQSAQPVAFQGLGKVTSQEGRHGVQASIRQDRGPIKRIENNDDLERSTIRADRNKNLLGFAQKQGVDDDSEEGMFASGRRPAAVKGVTNRAPSTETFTSQHALDQSRRPAFDNSIEQEFPQLGNFQTFQDRSSEEQRTIAISPQPLQPTQRPAKPSKVSQTKNDIYQVPVHGFGHNYGPPGFPKRPPTAAAPLPPRNHGSPKPQPQNVFPERPPTAAAPLPPRNYGSPKPQPQNVYQTQNLQYYPKQVTVQKPRPAPQPQYSEPLPERVRSSKSSKKKVTTQTQYQQVVASNEVATQQRFSSYGSASRTSQSSHGGDVHADYSRLRPNIPILQEGFTRDDKGYRYYYTTGDHQQKEEVARIVYNRSRQQGSKTTNSQKEEDNRATLQVQGKYSYVAPDGTPINLRYEADERGFRAYGDHLPTPPPLPAALVEAIQQHQKAHAEAARSASLSVNPYTANNSGYPRDKYSSSKSRKY